MSVGAKLVDPSFEFKIKFENIDYDEKNSLVKSLNRRNTDRLTSSVSFSIYSFCRRFSPKLETLPHKCAMYFHCWKILYPQQRAKVFHLKHSQHQQPAHLLYKAELVGSANCVVPKIIKAFVNNPKQLQPIYLVCRWKFSMSSL